MSYRFNWRLRSMPEGGEYLASSGCPYYLHSTHGGYMVCDEDHYPVTGRVVTLNWGRTWVRRNTINMGFRRIT